MQGEVNRLISQVDLFWEKEIRCYRQFGLQDGMSILECGSGPGHVIYKILAEYPACRATAVEIDPYLVRILNERLNSHGEKRCAVLQQSITDLGFSDNRFDFVITRLVLEHLPDPVGAVKEVLRVLKPGGKAVFVDNDFEMHLKTFPEIPEFNTFYDAYCRSRIEEGGNPRIGRELPVILKKAGFTHVDMEVICAHSGVKGDQMFLKTEGIGIPSQLVKDGYLHKNVLDQLAIQWHKTLANKDHSIFRQLFVAGGEKGITNETRRRPDEWSDVISASLPPSMASSERIDSVTNSDRPAERINAIQKVFSVPPEKQLIPLSDYLRDQVANLLHLTKKQVDQDEPVINLGFDSLMAVEVKNNVETDFDVQISVMDFFEGQSIADVAKSVWVKLKNKVQGNVLPGNGQYIDDAPEALANGGDSKKVEKDEVVEWEIGEI